ncbi:MAG: cell division protein FtsA [Rhodospirillales bacterium]|nr:MAG: cell division protein FtsA [Rhodospirillales bacterium]
MARNGLIAALDIGSSKICCLIGVPGEGENIRVIGIGHHVSRGIKSGTIVDMDAAEESVTAAVLAAERMAGETARDVVVGVAGGQLSSRLIDMRIGLNGGPVRDSDLRRLLYNGGPEIEPNRVLLHALPVGYSIDGSNGIHDPRGLHGQVLAVHVHELTASATAIRNVTTCVERCHLNVSDVVASPFAAGLATLARDEMELGVTVIDIGGGATSYAIFLEGTPVFAGSVPVGGSHVTNDIARGLATPLAHAERLKTLHGSALPSISDERETVVAPQVGEDPSNSQNHIPKSFLVSIIAARIEEVLELVRGELDAVGASRMAGRRIVLTGGGCQLPGLQELAARTFDRQVRVGSPVGFEAMATATSGPAFAACAGLLRFATVDTGDLRTQAGYSSPAVDGLLGRLGPLGRLGGWLRENL